MTAVDAHARNILWIDGALHPLPAHTAHAPLRTQPVFPPSSLFTNKRNTHTQKAEQQGVKRGGKREWTEGGGGGGVDRRRGVKKELPQFAGEEKKELPLLVVLNTSDGGSLQEHLVFPGLEPLGTVLQ